MGCGQAKESPVDVHVPDPSAPSKEGAGGVTSRPLSKKKQAKLSKKQAKLEQKAALALLLDNAQAALARLEAVQPSHYFKVQALLDSVASGTLLPLKGTYVVWLHKSGGRIRSRQDMPPEAFFSAAELYRLVKALGDDWGVLFVALSYRWIVPTAIELQPGSARVEHSASVCACRRFLLRTAAPTRMASISRGSPPCCGSTLTRRNVTIRLSRTHSARQGSA